MKESIIDLHTAIQGEGKLAGVPHILVRTSGCNLRCIFGNSACDTPYSSFTPEKSKYSFQDLVDMVVANPQIRHIIISGGEPCLYPDFIKRVLDSFGHHVVTVETNGTIFPPSETAEVIDLVSISPKLYSSIPTEEKCVRVNQTYSEGRELSHRTLIQNLQPIADWITSALEYQLKYVINSEEDIQEVLDQTSALSKMTRYFSTKAIYLMPAGVTNEQLQEKRAWLMERCIDLGFNYTDRLQILAYGNKRGV